MEYEQVITPNPDVPCKPGWCLQYVQDTFGISAVYPSAIASWNTSTTKHEDQDFPEGVAVPLWFSLNGNPYGHVALRMPDGSVYSSSHPTANTPIHHPSLAALDSYYGRGTMLNYLGWTEDVEGTLVITQQQPTEPSQGGDMPVKTNLDTARILAHGVLARNGIAGRVNALTGATDEDLANHTGIDLTNEYVQSLFLSAEGRQWRDTQDGNSIQGINARLGDDAANKQSITELQYQLESEQTKSVGLVSSVSDLMSKLDDAQKQILALKSQAPAPIAPAIDQATKDSIKQTNESVSWIRSLFTAFEGAISKFKK